MTFYVMSTTESHSVTAGTTVASRIYALSPVSSEIRITQLYWAMLGVSGSDETFTPVFGYAPSVYRNTGGSASGGTTVTPTPLRSDATAASTTARWGSAVSISGTQTYVYSPLPLTGSNTTAASNTYKFPSDFIISPGAVFSFATGGIFGTGSSGATINGTVQVQLYFEELRLSWHT